MVTFRAPKPITRPCRHCGQDFITDYTAKAYCDQCVRLLRGRKQ